MRPLLAKTFGPVPAFILPALLICTLFLPSVHAASGNVPDPLGRAFEHLYRLQFPAAHQILDDAEREVPNDPVLHVARSAAYLFSELNRLGILAAEFFQDDGERLRRQRLAPDAGLRTKLDASIAQARRLSQQRLRLNPADADALFALTMTSGIECNYAVFVEKKRLGAFALAKRSHEYAVLLLELQPSYDDARVVVGTNEYLVASLPFFVRWFVHFRGIEGSKAKAVQELDRVTRSGEYFMSFAKILLAAIHLREKRWPDARVLLDDLAARYPENPLFERELARLDERNR